MQDQANKNKEKKAQIINNLPDNPALRYGVSYLYDKALKADDKKTRIFTGN